jgi:soluble lytic murein transglycosylase-like protein
MRERVRIAVACALCLAANAVRAQIFIGAEASGAPVLSNFQTDATPAVLIAAPVSDIAAAVPLTSMPVAPALPSASRAAEAARLQPLIALVAKDANLSPHLLRAVIAVESAYDTRAVSRKGAQGLMQLMPATAQRFGVTDAFDPRQNLTGGAAYLKWLLQRFDGNLELALAAYNAGEAAVVKAGYRVPPLPETRAYVPRVLERLRAALS